MRQMGFRQNSGLTQDNILMFSASQFLNCLPFWHRFTLFIRYLLNRNLFLNRDLHFFLLKTLSVNIDTSSMGFKQRIQLSVYCINLLLQRQICLNTFDWQVTSVQSLERTLFSFLPIGTHLHFNFFDFLRDLPDFG